ncbi:nucleoside transporter [Candidatus Sumerlaeota bacterium]|nr:nucleoside transporter [Candidatus Sumerlaeota bacterium]
MQRVTSAMGVITLVAVAWVFSRDRRHIPWRTVIPGILLQIIIAVFLLQSLFGGRMFHYLNVFVVNVLSHGRKGAELVFGALAVPPGETGGSGERSLGFFLFFQGFPIIIFVASLMAALYYLRIMPRIVEMFAWAFSRLMKLSGAESLVTANNIFVGIESVFAIRPFLLKLTQSELHLLLTAGMATIASSVLGFYTLLLKDQIPGIAGHLISASLLSAPAAIVMSKVLYPEKEKPVTLGMRIRLGRDLYAGEEGPPSSLLDAMVQGAMEGVKLIIGICALLIAFLGILSLLNWLVGGIGGWFGMEGFSFEKILGWIFYPVSIACGVAPKDAEIVSSLWGIRSVATEVPAYIQLAGEVREGLDPRSAVIAAYGLCGFAHVASMAIFVGGTAALAPERRKDLVRLGPSALLAANLACFQTAAIAGLCLSATSSVILQGI